MTDYGDDLKNKTAALLKSIETGDPAAGAAINAESYTQHNNGKLGAMASLSGVE